MRSRSDVCKFHPVSQIEITTGVLFTRRRFGAFFFLMSRLNLYLPRKAGDRESAGSIGCKLGRSHTGAQSGRLRTRYSITPLIFVTYLFLKIQIYIPGSALSLESAQLGSIFSSPTSREKS